MNTPRQPHRCVDLEGLRVLAVGTELRTGPRAVRSLRRAGCKVVCADRAGSGALHGRSMAGLRVHRHPDPITAPEAMAAWIAQAVRRLRVDAVMPLSEDAVRVIATLQPDTGPARLAAPTRDQYLALCDKAGLADTAARLGIAHPHTVAVDGASHDAGLPLPVVVKTADSTDADLPIGGVVFADTAEERDEAVAVITAAGRTALVQEFVDGQQWTVNLVRGMDRWAGTTAAVARRTPRDAGTPSVLQVRRRDDALLAAMRLLDAVGYLGPANVQFIDRDGELVVHDVNLRPPASTILHQRAGLDIPAAGLAAALGRPWEPPETLRPLTYVWLEAEAKESIRADNTVAALGELARLATSRGVVIDPNPLDPIWVTRRALRAGRKALRR